MKIYNEFEQKNEAMQKKIHSLIEENSELKSINKTKLINMLYEIKKNRER